MPLDVLPLASSGPSSILKSIDFSGFTVASTVMVISYLRVGASILSILPLIVYVTVPPPPEGAVHFPSIFFKSSSVASAAARAVAKIARASAAATEIQHLFVDMNLGSIGYYNND